MDELNIELATDDDNGVEVKKEGFVDILSFSFSIDNERDVDRGRLVKRCCRERRARFLLSGRGIFCK
jgi:hypothetical protein